MGTRQQRRLGRLIETLSSLRIRVGLAILVGVGLFASFVIWYSTSTLSQAQNDISASTVLAIARTFGIDFERDDLRRPELVEQRLSRLKELNPEVVKASLYAVVDGHPRRIATTNADEHSDTVAQHDIEPLATGKYDYKDEREDGFHLAELNFPIAVDGRPTAVLGVYYDLGPIDIALAERKRQLAIAGVTTALLLTLLLTLVLGRTVFRPLKRLRTATHRLADGELTTRLHWPRRDELGTLSRDFDHMAAELERKHRQLETLALEDPLTGLANHRALKEELSSALVRAERAGQTVAVIAIDVDRFKQINDNLGHATGDLALRRVAKTIKAHVRPSDPCGRIGGDEFVLVLPGADSAAATRIVDRLSAEIESVDIGNAAGRLSISAGIAEFPRDARDEAELSRLADGALYSAKRSGRNRIVVYSPEIGDPLSPTEGVERERDTALANTIHGLARAVDARDTSTHMHSTRVALFAAALAEQLGLPSDRVEAVKTAGVVHDVGKIGISDAVLLKPGPLTAEEWAEMEHHSELGRDIVAGAGMCEIARWIEHLHERIDGCGYPHGAAADEIPLESRILAVADALEAMTSPRRYSDAMPLEQALAELEQNAGTQFDPDVVEAVFELVRENRLALFPAVVGALAAPAAA